MSNNVYDYNTVRNNYLARAMKMGVNLYSSESYVFDEESMQKMANELSEKLRNVRIERKEKYNNIP